MPISARTNTTLGPTPGKGLGLQRFFFTCVTESPATWSKVNLDSGGPIQVMVLALSCFKHLMLLLLLPNPYCVVAVAISEVFMGRVRINTCKHNVLSPLKNEPSSRTRRRNQLHAKQDQSSLSHHHHHQQAWKTLILLPLLLF